MVTEKVKLPDDLELNVDETNVTYPVLQAASFYLGKKCEEVNNEFLLCKVEEKDPRRCLKEGRDVAACTLDFFKQLKKHCKDDFEKHVDCIDTTYEFRFMECRESQAVVDKCVLENLNIERPGYGYFSEMKIHDSTRPEPKEPFLFPDALPQLPTEKPKYPSKFGTRMAWWL